MARSRNSRCGAGPVLRLAAMPGLCGGLRHGRGQALVETALAIPLLLALVAAIVTYGQVYGAYQTVAVASHAGARKAATGGSADDVRDVVIEALGAAGLDGGATVSVDGVAALAGEPVTVAVAAGVASLLPFPGVPDPMIVSAQTVMRKE